MVFSNLRLVYDHLGYCMNNCLHPRLLFVVILAATMPQNQVQNH